MNIIKVFKVSKELFQYRKYTIIRKGYLSDVGWFIHGMDASNNKVSLYINTHPKLNIDILKYYYQLFHQDHTKTAIIVYQNTFTSSVNKLVKSLDIKIELFCSDELTYNVIHHAYVPTHTKVAFSKKNDLKYPIMKRTDPVARFLGFRTGDIVKIVRLDQTIYYRYVK